MDLDLIRAVSAFAQAMIGTGAFVLSYVLWKGGKRKSQLEYVKSIQDGWNSVNNLILSNPELAVIADEVLIPANTGQDEQRDRLKRYMQFKILNILEMEYMGQKAGLVVDGYHQALEDRILKRILMDTSMINLLDAYGYHSEFVDYCRNILMDNSACVEQANSADTLPRPADQ